MKRRSFAKRRDANEPDIVSALEKIGATILRLDEFDLLVGYQGANHMLEVKNREGKNRITESQAELMETWRGSPLQIIRTVDEAVAAVTGKSE